MTASAPAQLFDALAATWPPAGYARLGPFRLRRGMCGGQRVSAATWDETSHAFDARSAVDMLPAVEAQMRDWGQRPLFMIRGAQDSAFEGILLARGYAPRDETLLMRAPASQLARSDDPGLGACVADRDLAICRSLWARAGVDHGRMGVIDRVPPPATAILGRASDDPCGVALAGCADAVAMVHALWVSPTHRRCGTARAMMLRAARWAVVQGATEIAVAVVSDNDRARALFAGLGLREACAYRYLRAPDP